MIGRLSGLLVEKTGDYVVLDVNGVGYEASVPASSLCRMPPIGNEVTLSVYTHVREDALRLFGFWGRADRSVFEMLLSVSNVGPKLALALLGPFDGKELCKVIIEENLAALTSVPGVGARTAERLMVELRTKAQKVYALLSGESDTPSAKTKGQGNQAMSVLAGGDMWTRHSVLDDLKSALQNLGYKDKQISEVVGPLEKRQAAGEELVLEAALKESLRQLSGHLLGR
ncbi:MAG: Holliday junction branch migration protein RuvA [Proteobacteria bacterium]|nr:Holliday junction branch migration protein RuvA [Pseudomonadota bacterium]